MYDIGKKLVAIGIALGFLLPVVAFAVPSSVNRVTDHIEPLITTDFIKGSYFTATSTSASSTFANGLNLTAGCFSIAGVCLTSAADGTFSTTSANYWSSVGLGFSTTSADVWGTSKGYITGIAWGAITGTLSNQTDLAAALYGKLGTSSALASGAALIYATGANTVASVSTSTCTINSPLSGSLTSFNTCSLSIANAAADGETKGAASFTANDFDATTGNISIDYKNGQAASASLKGFLTSADWLTFNNKVATGTTFTSGSVAYWGNNGTLFNVATGTVSGTNGVTATAGRSVLGGALTIDCTAASASAAGCLSAANWRTFNNKVATGTTFTSGSLASWGTNGTLYNTATGTISATSPVTVTAGRSAIGGAAVFAWDFSVANTWTGLQTFNTGGIISNASSTFLGAVFPAVNRFGLGSSTPSALWGGAIGTSTIVMGAQFAMAIASSTANSAAFTLDLNSGNTQRFILQQNTTVTLNSTSSNPIDGTKVLAYFCQDPVGSRTLTWATANKIAWAEGTTTISSTANTATIIGFIYDARAAMWIGIASSTIRDTRVCKP